MRLESRSVQLEDGRHRLTHGDTALKVFHAEGQVHLRMIQDRMVKSRSNQMNLELDGLETLVERSFLTTILGRLRCRKFAASIVE